MQYLAWNNINLILFQVNRKPTRSNPVPYVGCPGKIRLLHLHLHIPYKTNGIGSCSQVFFSVKILRGKRIIKEAVRVRNWAGVINHSRIAVWGKGSISTRCQV